MCAWVVVRVIGERTEARPASKPGAARTLQSAIELRSTATEESVVIIHLSNGNVLVDAADYYDKLQYRPWFFKANQYASGREHTDAPCEDMHKVLWQMHNHELPPGYSVDHINRTKADNRMKNLRAASSSDQNKNRGTRSDRAPLPDALLVEVPQLEGQELPRYIRYDVGERRFTFVDMPAYKALLKMQPPLAGLPSCNGTKAEGCSIAQRLIDCLEKYKCMCELYRQRYNHAPLMYHEDDHEGNMLAAELMEITAAASAHDPERFAQIGNGPVYLLDLERHTTDLLELLRSTTEDGVTGGRKRRRCDEVVCTVALPAPPDSAMQQQQSISVRRGLDGVTVVYDTKFEDVFKALTWDKELHVVIGSLPDAVREALLAKERNVPAWMLKSRKVKLNDFVGTVLLGLNADGDGCVIPLNFQHNDVRAANLAAAPGTGKQYKASASLEWPAEATVTWPEGYHLAGQRMRYKPRGVKVCVGERSVDLHYKKNAIKKKTMKDESELGSRFNEFFVPVLNERWKTVSPYAAMVPATPEACTALSEGWLAAHVYYSRLIDEYQAAIEPKA